MRRRIFLLLLVLLCLFTACGREPAQREPEATNWQPVQMARAIYSSQDPAVENVLLYGDELFGPYITDYYGLDADDVSDGAVFYAGGVYALEVAVFRLADGGDGSEAVRALEGYIDARAGAFAGYAPEQYAVVEGSEAVSRGQYAALLICPDLAAAKAVFDACFTSDPPLETAGDPPSPAPAPVEAAPEPEPEPVTPTEPAPEPEPVQETDPSQEQEPPKEPDPVPVPEAEEPDPEPEPIPQKQWSYSEQRILDAWSSGSPEGLWEEDIEILGVLESISALTDGTLTDYERELALHDWMIAWAEYDPGALSSGPRGEPIPHNDNPYGFLTGRKGICLGYATTFQLLMDLSGIECILVNGTAHDGAEDHAWNLVRLDGEWYAVDTTWDDPVTTGPVSAVIAYLYAHQYFNVTDAFLRQHDHQWDESAVPAATGTAWAWKG